MKIIGKAFEWIFVNLLFWGGIWKLISSVPESLDPGDIQEHQIAKIIYLLAVAAGLGWALHLQGERKKEQKKGGEPH